MGKNKKQPDHVREKPMTYDDYKELPFEEGVHYELVNGSLQLMSPSTSTMHQLILSGLYHKIRQTCAEEYIILFAPLDVILSDREVRQPDLLMVHRSRLSIITKRGIEGPPDMVAEILSPSSIKNDKISKIKSYAQYANP
jgi:Uma2 family endonuclease